MNSNYPQYIHGVRQAVNSSRLPASDGPGEVLSSRRVERHPGSGVAGFGWKRARVVRQRGATTGSSGGTVARLVAASVLAAWLALTGVSGSAQEPNGTPALLPVQGDSSEPCFDGRLRLRDLEHADPSIERGLERVYQIGRAWEDDAMLYSLRLGCPLLETGYQWEGTFFSRTAQAFFETDTGRVLPAEDDPRTVSELGTNGLQVHFVYRSLMRAGFSPDALLSAGSGVTIRYNTDAQPFGPPSAPRGDVYFHLAILQRGEVTDVWVASQDGTIYGYTAT